MAEKEAETSLLDDVRAAASELAGGNDATTVQVDRPNGAASGEVSADLQRDRPGAGETGAGARARDESGRFKAKAEEGKPRETLSLKEPAGSKAKQDGNEQPLNGAEPAGVRENRTTEQAADKPAPILAPTEWKGAAKVKWDRLPREVQAEIVERHTAAEQRVAAYAPLEQAIAPYRESWIKSAGSVESALTQLGEFEKLYWTNPVALIQHIAASRGINLGAPQGQQQPQGGGAPQAPDLASIVKQIVEQQVAPIQQRFAQTENQQLESTISAFASDPKHPFFQDVKTHMGQLLAGGSAKTLDEAYEQATWANPTIRAHLLAQQDEQRTKQQAAEVAKANAARAASLRGSPLPGGGNAAANGSASVLDDVRAAAAEIAGA